MTQRTQNQSLLFWTAIVVLSALFFLVKALGAQWIHDIYHHDGGLALLNALSGSPVNLTLDFYQGRIEETLLGPLTNVLAIGVLLVLSRRYLVTASPLRVTLAVFLFLIISKWEVLSFPAYGDPIGAWVEAIWLKRNHFDYTELIQQANYAQGGPKVYLFSLYPSFVALLLAVLPSVKMMLAVHHILVFGLAAGVTGLFYAMLRRIFESGTALLASLLLLTLPLFQTMTELMNLEMPTLFFVTLTAFLLTRKRFAWAAASAILAALVKGFGGIAAAGVLITAVFCFFFDKADKHNFKICLWGLIAVGVAFLKVYLRRFVITGPTLDHNTLKPLVGILPVVSCKVIVTSGVLTLLTFIIVLLRQPRTGQSWFERHYTGFILFLFCLLWFGVHLNFSVMGPRYKLLIAPFLLYTVIWSARSLLTERWIKRGLVVAILTAASASYGLFYKPVESVYYAYVFLERSLEYRNDMKLHQKLATAFEEEYPNVTIGAPFVTAQKMALPELGYTPRQRDVLVYGAPLKCLGITIFPGLKHIDIANTLWIGFISDFSKKIPYPMDPEDQFIRELHAGNKKATLFRGGVALEKMRIVSALIQAGKL